MTSHELLTAAISVSAKIDVLWGMFITVHAAIFGFLYIKEVTLNKFQVAVLGVGYFCFFLLNFLSLHSSYQLLSAIHADLIDSFPNDSSDYLPVYLRSLSLENLTVRTGIFHLLALAGVIIAIWRNRELVEYN